MVMFKSLVLLTIILVTGITATAQSPKTTDSLKRNYQQCLDKGGYMLSCSILYYAQMDSLLNMRYRKLRAACDSTQKENLKDEQLGWLEKRDQQFRINKQQIHREAVKGGYNGGQDEDMMVTDENAKYVERRVRELISRRPGNYSASQYAVQATGTYSFNDDTVRKNDEIYGYYGSIRVKEIAGKRVVVHLFICKGAPSYNSGSFTDTLDLYNNTAVYTTEYDPSCKMVFRFYKRGIMVEQYAENINFACGFGHAVDAQGFYRRKSAKVPADSELTEEE